MRAAWLVVSAPVFLLSGCAALLVDLDTPQAMKRVGLTEPQCRTVMDTWGGRREQWAWNLPDDDCCHSIRAAIVEAMNRFAGAAERCWRAASVRDDKPVRVLVHYVMGRDGRIVEACAVQRSGPPEVGTCLVQQLRGLETGVEPRIERLLVTYPLVFENRPGPVWPKS